MATSNVPERQYMKIVAGSDVQVNVTLDTPQSISGWTITFEMWRIGTTTISLTKTTSSGITITDAASGVIQIDFDAVDTASLAVDTYLWQIERTNAGFDAPLAVGELSLVSKHPVT